MVGVTLLASALAAGGLAALPRAETDRPDEVRGPQIHVIYAVPADGADRGLDTNGSIEASVAAFQAWLATQTGGPTLRADTFQGALDVTFARLDRSDGEIASRGAFVRDEVEAALGRAGLLAPTGKLYAVYYDGSSTFACGGAAWPPAVPGRIAAMYLRGRPPGFPACDTNPVGAGLGYWEFAMLHDLLHTLGIVGTCAPNHTRAGHVSDSSADLMWAGDAPWEPSVLDAGRDDYYGHGRADCPDLARSPYLTSTPPPPPVLRARAFSLVRGRGTVTATLTATVDDQPPAGGRARCTARLAGRPLRARLGYRAGRATCRWTPGRAARGKRLRGEVAVVTAAGTVRRTFSTVVR